MNSILCALRTGLVVLAVCWPAVACGGGPSESGAPGAPRVITADGSSTVAPVTEAVAEEFQRANPGNRVTVGTSGTGGGFQKFCRDETDISDASRPITPTRSRRARKAGVTYIEMPVAYDGLAVVVNPKNTWAASMTVAELKTLWEPAAQGKIMRWNQIRAELARPGDPPVRRRRRFRARSTTSPKRSSGRAKPSRGDYTSSEDDNVIVQGVSGDENALGYFGFAYYEENNDKLKLVADRRWRRQATARGRSRRRPRSVKNGTYRPLSRPIFIYPKVKALERPEVKSFVDFYLNQGIPLVREVGYIPLTDNEYTTGPQPLQRAQDRFDVRGRGQPQPGDARAAV